MGLVALIVPLLRVLTAATSPMDAALTEHASVHPTTVVMTVLRRTVPIHVPDMEDVMQSKEPVTVNQDGLVMTAASEHALNSTIAMTTVCVTTVRASATTDMRVRIALVLPD